MASNNKFKILAFDPGLTSTGWSLLESEIGSQDVVILKIGELHPGQLADRAAYRDEVNKFDKRVVTLRLLREGVAGLLNEFNPDFVTAEDIFINPRRPQAYGGLCMAICMMKMICRDVSNKRLVTIPTKIAKLDIAHSGSSGKRDVMESVTNHPNIKFASNDLRLNLSEHEADSIAVGWSLTKRYKDLIAKELEARNVCVQT